MICRNCGEPTPEEFCGQGCYDEYYEVDEYEPDEDEWRFRFIDPYQFWHGYSCVGLS